jgi:7TM diverse intracellular signalling
MKIHCRWVLLCWLFTAAVVAKAQVRFQAEAGFLDAREWNFASARLPLSGYWMFYPNQLITAQQSDSIKGVESVIPALWNATRTDGNGEGFATYTLKVAVPDTIRNFTLEVPQIYNAYVLYVNDKMIASAGSVGNTKEKTTPAWNHQFVKFSVGERDTIQLVLQVANFHHAKGGVKEQLFLGVASKTEANFSLAKVASAFESGLLLLLGLVFIVLFFFRRQPVALYFGLFCINWSVRAVFSNLYVIMDWFPDLRWEILVRVEYMTLYFAMSTAAAFLHHLFLKMGAKPLVTYIVLAVNVMFIVFTLIASPLVFTKSVSLFIGVAGLIVVYGAIMVIRALLFEYVGAWFLMASVLVGVMIFGYDIIAYQTSLAPNFAFLSIGYIVMFSLTAMGLLFQMNVLKGKASSDILTFEDMMKLDSPEGGKSEGRNKR